MSQARASIKLLSRDERRELFSLAQKGQRHPDSRVASAAYIWGHSKSWNMIGNREPGWLLPSVAAILVVASIAVDLPIIFQLALGVVVVLGLLGWNSKSAAARLRQLYPDPPEQWPQATPAE